MKISQELIEQITQLVVQELAGGRTKSPSLSHQVSDGRILQAVGVANRGNNRKEVAIGVGPAYGQTITKTINSLPHGQVLQEIMAGIEEEGMVPRIVQVYKTSDVAFIGKEAARLSGSGVAVGLQSKGTAIIHQKDLYPLTNLELFPQAPLLNLETYRLIGKNAARYAKGVSVKPIASKNDFTVRAKYQVKAALMHTKETEGVITHKASMDSHLKEV